MSRYIAKKVRLTTMQECKQPGCSCFTQNGYYIQYRNSSVDSILFVCDCCYEEKYKSECSMGDFDEGLYMAQPGKPSYQQTNPLLGNLIRWTRKSVRTLRKAMIAAAVILVMAFCIKEQPDVRTELTLPKVHTEINREIHLVLRDLGPLEARVDTIKHQGMKIFTQGGKTND